MKNGPFFELNDETSLIRIILSVESSLIAYLTMNLNAFLVVIVFKSLELGARKRSINDKVTNMKQCWQIV